MRTKKWGMFVIVASLCSFAVTVGADIDAIQEQQTVLLDKVEDKLLPMFESLETKQTDPEIRTQVQETQTEIQILIETQKESLAQAQTIGEVREIMEETKDRLVLKTFDAITPQNPLEETLLVVGGAKEKKQAVVAVLEVIGTQDRITIPLSTTKDITQVELELQSFDSQVVVEELFREEELSYLQVSFEESSLLKQELFAELGAGVLPTYFLGYKIVKPEVYTIGQLLSGEQTALLRGQQRRQTPLYYNALRDLPKIRVGVIDTGVDPTHSDLAHAISTSVPGYDFVNNDADPFDDHMHGTHVAGTIASVPNGSGVFGVHPFVEIVPLKICTKTGYCPSYAITNALVYAADAGVEVLNMSLGGPGNVLNNPTCAAIAYATSKGSIAVVAAGNAQVSATTFIPASCEGVITVGAVNNSLQRASFSNYGARVDISAPGVAIYSTIPGGGWKSLDGTSMATPHVSAALAVLLAKAGKLSLSQAKSRLLAFTTPVTYESGKPIGPFLNYPALMQDLGIGASGNMFGCSVTGCSSQGTIPTPSPAPSSGEEVSVQGLVSSHTGVVVGVGKTVLIHLSQGTPPYRLQKSSDHIGFAHQTAKVSTGIQVASAGSTEVLFEGMSEGGADVSESHYEEVGSELLAEDNEESELVDLLGDLDEEVRIASAQEFSFRVLGLQPGTTKITITDATGKKKEIPVEVKEEVFYMKPYQYSKFVGNDIYTYLRLNGKKCVAIL